MRLKKMKIHQYMCNILILFALLFSIVGCAHYGKVGYEPPNEVEVTLEDLIDSWSAYHVYYSGYDVNNAAGILFDPKADDKTLMPTDRWIKVNDKETLIELISWIKLNDFPSYLPRVYKIYGPEDALYGYIYSGWYHAVAKVIDENSMLLYDLPDPPHYYGPDGNDNKAP